MQSLYHYVKSMLNLQRNRQFFIGPMKVFEYHGREVRLWEQLRYMLTITWHYRLSRACVINGCYPHLYVVFTLPHNIKSKHCALRYLDTLRTSIYVYIVQRIRSSFSFSCRSLEILKQNGTGSISPDTKND